MSKPQRNKGHVKPRQEICTKPKHKSPGYAKVQIASMKASNLVGTGGLSVYECKTCSRKEKKVFHVGHRRRGIA